MACDCIKKLADEVRELFGDSAELTNVRMAFNITHGGSRDALEPLRYRYHPKKQDGGESKKWKTGFIGFSYCPFCGTAYGSIPAPADEEAK